jgi:hypothetical protein
MHTTQQTMVNGLDTTKIVETLGAIQSQPALARFEFRADNVWVDGGENRSTIQGFYGASREDDSRRTPFVFTNGEPPVLLGNNEARIRSSSCLHALAGCVTTTTVLHAAARHPDLARSRPSSQAISICTGLLGLDDTVSPGYREIRMTMHIDADCSPEELNALMTFAQGHSPVCNTLCRPVPVKLEWVRADEARRPAGRS